MPYLPSCLTNPKYFSMKMILKIARHELKMLFCSPIAWIMLVIFLYSFGRSVLSNIDSVSELFDVENGFSSSNGFTHMLFSLRLLPDIQGKIYFFIPLLTMGLMSQELNTGTIKLLFSSPIKTKDIVLGKYFGMMLYWLIVICLFCLLTIPAYFVTVNFDWGIALPGLLAVFLLACTYSAIGLFMSCVNNYQVVAALSTLTILAALNYVGGMWQGIPVIKDIVNFLDMTGHAANMNAGFIKSRDVLYFFFITVLFIGMSILYMGNMVHFRPRTKRVKRYVLFTGIILGLGVLVSLRGTTLYFDTTATKFNTITPFSQNLLGKIKGPVSITCYTNLLGNDNPMGMPENRKSDFNFWEPYIRFLPQLELKYVNYFHPTDTLNSLQRIDSIAAYQSAVHGWYMNDFLSPKKIDQLVDLSKEGYLNPVRRIAQGIKYQYLRLFNDGIKVPSEQNIATAFSGLISPYPKIAFLTGHHERGIQDNEDRGYKIFVNDRTNRGSLINTGFDPQTVSIDDMVKKKFNALLIADPLIAFSAEEIQKIEAYIDSGGNLMIAGGPNSQTILNPIVAHVGVTFLPGQLMQRNPGFPLNFIFTKSPLREGGDTYPFQFEQPLAMPGSISLRYKSDRGFNVTEALVSNEDNTWNAIREFPSDSTQLSYQPERGDKRGEFPVAISLTRKVGNKAQRIVIVGNASFISNEIMNFGARLLPFSHTSFGSAIFKWLGNTIYPLEIVSSATPKDDRRWYPKKSFFWMKPVYSWFFPVLLLLVGSVFLIRRRRN